MYEKVWNLGESGHLDEHNLINRRRDELLDIRDLGANTSFDDNSSYIQTALNEAAEKELLVYIPVGNWKHSQTLKIKGSHCGLHGRGLLNYTGNNYALIFGNEVNTGNYSRLYLEGVRFYGNDNALGAIKHTNCVDSLIQNINISNFLNGKGVYYLDRGWINHIINSSIGGCNIAVHFDTIPPTGSYSGNSVSITGGSISGSNIGVLVGNLEQTEPQAPIAATALTLERVTFQSLHEWAIYLSDGQCINIGNNYFEDNGLTDFTGHIKIGNDVGSYPNVVNIYRNQMVNNANSGGRCIVVNSIVHGKIHDNLFYMNRDNNIAVEVIEHTGLKVEHNFIAANVDIGYSGITED